MHKINSLRTLSTLSITAVLLCLPACAVFETTPAADTAAAAERTAYLSCGGCHGAENVRVSLMPPNIIGQKKGYLIAKLRDFRDLKRIHPHMNGVVAKLTDQDIVNLATYYATYAQSKN
jgi:cytochrome c553